MQDPLLSVETATLPLYMPNSDSNPSLRTRQQHRSRLSDLWDLSFADHVVCNSEIPYGCTILAVQLSDSSMLACHRYGVGGEYPMAAGSAAERAETGGIQKARFRGREVVLTFSMQVSHQLQMQWKLPTPGRPLFSSLIRTLG